MRVWRNQGRRALMGRRETGDGKRETGPKKGPGRPGPGTVQLRQPSKGFYQGSATLSIARAGTAAPTVTDAAIPIERPGSGTRPTPMTSRKGLSSYAGRTRIVQLTVGGSTMLNYPGSSILYTVLGGVLFPASMIAGRRETGNGKGETGQKKGPGFPGPWAAYGCLSNGAQPSTRTYSNSYSAAVKSRARRPRPRPKMAGIGGHDTDFGRVPRRLLGTGNRYGATLFLEEAGRKEGGPRWKAALTTGKAPIARSSSQRQDSPCGGSCQEREAAVADVEGMARRLFRPGRESNPDHPRRQRGALSVKLPGHAIYTVQGPVLFPASMIAGRRETGGGG